MTRITVAAAAIGGTLAVRRLRMAGGRSAAAGSSEQHQPYETAGHRILILGGGFGGVSTALTLDRQVGQRDDVSILVVDRDSAMLFFPLLWTVGEGRADPSDVVVPVRAFQRRSRFQLLHAEVTAIDLDRREVETSVEN